MYGHKLVTPPTSEPVSLAEVKAHCRVTVTDDDTYLDTLITVARRYVEEICNLALLTQTWDLFLDCFPDGEILLPRAPVLTIGFVKYIDQAGVLQTLASNQYQADVKQYPARLRPAYNVWFWPLIQPYSYSTVNVRYDAGYGAASDVPDEIKHVIKLLVGHWYENREDSISGTIIQRLPLGMDMLLAPHRVWLP